MINNTESYVSPDGYSISRNHDGEALLLKDGKVIESVKNLLKKAQSVDGAADDQARKVRHAFENIRNNYVGWEDNPNFKVIEQALSAPSDSAFKEIDRCKFQWRINIGFEQLRDLQIRYEKARKDFGKSGYKTGSDLRNKAINARDALSAVLINNAKPLIELAASASTPSEQDKVDAERYRGIRMITVDYSGMSKEDFDTKIDVEISDARAAQEKAYASKE